MTHLTKEQLDALEATYANATQEEWEVHDLGSTMRDDEGDWTVIEITRGDYLVADLYAVECDPEDRAKELATAHAVALMHNAAPSLVAEVRRSREVADGLRRACRDCGCVVECNACNRDRVILAALAPARQTKGGE